MTVAGVTQVQRMIALRPLAWHRFNNLLTVVSGAVSSWGDFSGNKRPLLQATASLRPLVQTDGSLLFDGSNDYMAATFTENQPTTLYLLCRQVTWTSGDYISDGVTANSGAIIQTTGSPQLNLHAGSSVAGNSGLAVNTYGILTAIFNGASSSLRVNKLAPTTGDPGSGNMGGITLGADGAGANNGNIQVKEQIMFTSSHDLNTQGQVIAYLSSVGGLGL